MQSDPSTGGSRKPPGSREINIQNQILNFVRKDRTPITIFLVSGKKFVGQVLGFDRYTIHIRGRDYDQIVFKHAITNISLPRHIMAKMAGGGGDQEVEPPFSPQFDENPEGNPAEDEDV